MSKSSVLICGAGITGMATALALSKKGINVRLLSPQQTPQTYPEHQYHPRVYAISLASQQVFESLGIWQVMDSHRISAVDAMEIHGDQGGKLVLDAWQAAQSHLAWIVESAQMEKALYQAVRVYGIEWIDDKLSHLDQGRVVTEQGQVLEAELLIGADGALSPLRKASGIAHDRRAYNDKGLVVHLNVQYPHDQTAYQWFHQDGILALLPLPDTQDGHQVSMVWSLPDLIAQKWLDMDEQTLAQELPKALQKICQGRLGELSVRSPLFGFPLSLEKSAMVAPGVALIGDAAHRVHPLAGQGLNLGMSDVKALCDTLAAKESFRTYGDVELLARYRRARAEDIFKMRLATDGLHKLFSQTSTPIVIARNLGMTLVQSLPFVKRQLVMSASGLL